MEECPSCGCLLRIAGSSYKSELNSTDVYVEITQVCANEQCDNYAGRDLSKPLHVVNVERQKVN